MPSRLYFSNSLDALVDPLILGLKGVDPFDAPIIATPSPAMRGWLQIRVAERLGIAANIDFLQLEKLLWNRLAELDHFRKAVDRQPARLLDAMNFQGLILTLLRKNPPSQLQHYLHPDDGEPYDEARRLCQLAGRLAALFREYEYSRVSEGGFKGLTETWNKGEACFEQYMRGPKFSTGQREQVRKLEAWQREVYQALFREKGVRDSWGEATGVYRYTLPQYAEMVLSQKRNVADSIHPSPTFHLFGLSNISPFHRALIQRLGDEDFLGADAARFEIYALNPCAEYWEDAVNARGRLTPDELQGEELPDEAGENALLNRFGKPGRETIQLWNQITDYDFTGDFREPENDTLLAAVQRAVLHRNGPLPSQERIPQDASLQIWSAPDRYAEVEGTRAHIGELLLADPSLKLEDIAIIPADFETYLPVIETLFDKKEAGQIPYCLPEAGMLRESNLLRGFHDLIELGSGPFRPGMLLTWLENPVVQKKLRVNAGAVSLFGKMLEDSGFQEGWDEEHQLLQHSVPGSLSTFEAAMKRTLLGLVLDASDPALETAGLHPAAKAAAWDRDELSRCLELLDNLRRDLRPFRCDEKQSFAQWSASLRFLLEKYFEVDSDQGLEIQAEKDLRRFCADLEQWDAEGITYHTILVLIDEHFREPRAVRMPFLTGGVRIGSLNALRSLPFRYAYLLGFTAGDFPSSREASPLDLRGYRRVIGEADPSSRDLYAFLEILSTVSEGLILSYVRRDAAKDSARQPSQALAGLTAYLESDVLRHTDGKPDTFKILELNAEGRYETNVIDNVEGWGKPPRPRLETLRLKALENLPEADAQRMVNACVPLPTPPKWAELPSQEKPVIDLQDLAAYLQNPLEHACFNHFRLYGSLEGDEDSAPPALFLDKWEILRLLEPALRAELLQPGEGEIAGRLAFQRQIWSGKGPMQPYANLEMESVEIKARSLIENSIRELRETIDGLGLHFAGTLRLGGQGPRLLDAPILDRPAFDAASLGVEARITGTLTYFFKGDEANGGWALLLSGSSDRDLFAAYLLYLCIDALDVENNFAGPGYVLSLDSTEIHRLPPFNAEGAGADLRELLQDFLRAPDFDHLPWKTIEKLAGKSDSDARQPGFDWKRKIEEREREESDSGPLTPRGGKRARIVRTLNPEVPSDAEAKIHRRILPFINWRESWEELE